MRAGLSTRALIRRRLAGIRDDDARLVIAVEGGGMRGVVSGAMLLALGELGVTRVAVGRLTTSVTSTAAGVTPVRSGYFDPYPWSCRT